MIRLLRFCLSRVASVLLLGFSVVLAACTIETQDPVFTRDDIVKVDAGKAAKMGFTPVKGKKTYLYTDREDTKETCAEVGFIPLDDEGRLYIAASLAHPCMKEESGYFYMLADFGAKTLKPVALDDKDQKPVRELAYENGIRLLYDDMNYRYVTVGDVSKDQMKAFFLALAGTEYAVTPEE